MTNEEAGLYVRFVQSPEYKDKLTDNMLSEVARFDNDDTPLKDGSIARKMASWIGKRVQDGFQVAERFSRYMVQGTEIRVPLEVGKEDNIYGTKVTLIGFAGPQNAEISGSGAAEIKTNYEKAIEDYETIKESFASDVWPETDSETLGEKALVLAIILSDNLGQRKTASELCEEFAENYDSVAPSICNSKYLFANTAVSGQGVVVNGKTHILSLEWIRKPSREEYGAQITISNAGGDCSGQSTLGREEENCLSDSESIKLVRVTEDYAEFDVGSVQESVGRELFWKTNHLKLKPGEFQVIGKNSYRINLDEINLQKVARVSLDPQVDYARTNATFGFKIGIEKRGIQLSPEKTTEKIRSLNSTVRKLESISNTLGKVISTGKKVCAVTAGALTLKNFFSNLGGKGIARQKVMRSSGGWYDQCRAEVNTPGSPYDDIESCLLGNSDEIEASVNAVNAQLNAQNEKMKQLQEGITTTSFLGETAVNTDELTKRFVNSEDFKSEISSCAGNGQIIIAGKTISKAEIAQDINPNRVSLTQIRDLQLYCRLLDSGDVVTESLAQKQVEKIFGEIYSNSEPEQTSFAGAFGQAASLFSSDKNLKEIPITEVKHWNEVQGDFNLAGVSIDTNALVYKLKDKANANEYLLVLDDEYVVKETYQINDKSLTKLGDDKNKNPLGVALKPYDASAYKNPYTDPIARYYETDPYRGLPAVVPFDTQDGWYAAIKSTLPVLGGLRAYDDSGRVSSFYVCNVGPGGREEFIGGNDICRGFYPRSGAAPNFPGLNEQQSLVIMQKAERAIEDAMKQYGTGVRQITINNKPVKVGSPAADIPDIQCEDFMSPTDCNIMFNACDPFICPSSRCDLGGNYPVKDVVQSGVIGSLLLCAPNFPEVKIPICVSGVHAGVEGWTSVLRSYEQCLQTSLDTGQTIGICDEINSVYMCEFVWRQGLPVVKYAAPRILSGILGQNTRGGGEYLTTQNAMDNVGKSFDYFTQYYADDSYRAFKARSAEQVGSELCRNYVSFAGPDGGNILDAFAAPDSPAQFYGRFEEIQVQTVTNPPSSHYKVFYHIYAGKDFPAYYQVYLRGTGGSFYQDASFQRSVASNFIPKGEFKTETLDFTAPSGYKELCIVVNGQEECGFKEVTTEFFINSITEDYVARQAKQTDVNSEAECVSGSPDAFNLLNPSLLSGEAQGVIPGVSDATNPAIYNRGIIRVCATGNPGKGTDGKAGTESSRWKDVGNCGSENLRCWLDANSVRDVIRNSATEEMVLGEVTDNYLQALQEEGGYINTTEFESLTKEILELQGTEGNDSKIIAKITEKIDKIFYNNQKGYLHLLRGISYSNLAQGAYRVVLDAQKQAGEITLDQFIQQTTTETAQEREQIGVDYPVFEFKDGTNAGNLFYTFSGDSWHWCSRNCDDKNNFYESEVALLPPIPQSSGADVTRSISIQDFEKLSSRNREFIKGLVGKDYSGGLKLLMERIIADKEGGWFFNPELSTDNVDMSYKKVFTVKNLEAFNLYLDYSPVKWRWAADSDFDDWVLVPELEIGPVPGQRRLVVTLTQSNSVKLIKSLEGKDFLEGAAIIFGIDAESFSVSGGGTDTETGIQTTGLTCTDKESCQKALGDEIIELAQQKKPSVASTLGLSVAALDSRVEADTGAQSFECLVLQVSYHESIGLNHCGRVENRVVVDYVRDGNPLYCDGNSDEVLLSGIKGEGSLGIMQINSGVHGEKPFFEENVNTGIDILASGYADSGIFRCHPQADGGFVPIAYSGWNVSLRNYNGWNTDCTKGNPNYVEDVLATKDEIAALFPEECSEPI